MANKQDNNDKLICGRTARKYLNCSKAEFEILVNRGLIHAFRDEYSRWRVSKESVLNYAAKLHSSNETRLIINENHYQEVIERICAAKSSIMKFIPIFIIMVLFLSCGNKSRHDVPPSSYEETKKEAPEKLKPYKIKGAKDDSPKMKEPAKSNNSTSKSGSSSYSSSRDEEDYDNMRGFDPASENDMDDNGMSRYMENNDEEGWD